MGNDATWSIGLPPKDIEQIKKWKEEGKSWEFIARQWDFPPNATIIEMLKNIYREHYREKAWFNDGK